MITLRNIVLRRGTKVVLDDASVVLQPGEKVGLVGRNGAGKSSLFALLTDRLHSDKGDVEIPRHWAMAEVAQHMPETDMPATEFVLEGDVRLMAARQALADAEAADDGHAIADAYAQLMDAGSLDAPARAQALMMGLGFKGAQVDAPVNSFSGGWRMRLQPGAGADVPVRPAAAGRADQPPGPGRPGLAGSAGCSAMPAR